MCIRDRNSVLQVIEKGGNHQLLRISNSLPINASEELARVPNGNKFNSINDS